MYKWKSWKVFTKNHADWTGQALDSATADLQFAMIIVADLLLNSLNSQLLIPASNVSF